MAISLIQENPVITTNSGGNARPATTAATKSIDFSLTRESRSGKRRRKEEAEIMLVMVETSPADVARINARERSLDASKVILCPTRKVNGRKTKSDTRSMSWSL